MLTGLAAKWQRLDEVYLGYKAGRGTHLHGNWREKGERKGGKQNGERKGIEKGKRR